MPAAAPVFEVEDETNETANPLAEREGQPSDERGAATIAGAVTHTSEAEDTVDIEAALAEGSLTSNQAIALQERRMERMRVETRAQIAQLRSELGLSAERPLALAATVRRVVARLTQTPTNYHQATVHYLSSDAPEDAAMARWAPLLYMGSLAMVVMQSMVAVGVFVGTVSRTCSSSDQCGAGTYCKLSGTPSTASPRPSKTAACKRPKPTASFRRP